MGTAVGRLGQLSARARFSSASVSTTRRLLANPWTCARCLTKSDPAGHRNFVTSAALGKHKKVKAAYPIQDPTKIPTLHDGDTTHKWLHIAQALYPDLDTFPRRHIGPDDDDTKEMLQALSPPSETLEAFVEQVIPASIRSDSLSQFHAHTGLGPSYAESSFRELFTTLAKTNIIPVGGCFLGTGYYGTHTPAVIQRNVLENPSWYTSYTPYQPEISQGRLESLLNFQTMVCDMTGLPVSNASLLDEGTAAAEAMTLSLNTLPASRAKREGRTFLVSDKLHPQTIEVVRGRADGLGIKVLEMDVNSAEIVEKIEELDEDLIGVMVQYPDTWGVVNDFRDLVDLVHGKGALLSCATDLLALTLLTPPGEWGADIAIGSAQRFGVPYGLGGPHAAFFAVIDKHKRKLPGRLVGLSKDRLENKAYRLTLQTREQHIRREKATSNVCTSQALLANMAAFYAIYHGPAGLKAIAQRANLGARVVFSVAKKYGFAPIESPGLPDGPLFDTVVVDFEDFETFRVVHEEAMKQSISIRSIGQTMIGFSIDETTTQRGLARIVRALDAGRRHDPTPKKPRSNHVLIDTLMEQEETPLDMPPHFQRTSSYLTHPVFNSYHSETELQRYIHHLQSKDLSLVHSMIPLGSCTMKLNSATEMYTISDPGFANIHPHARSEHIGGYKRVFDMLECQLEDITGMTHTSLQPNSGAQGEFAGLRTIREYLKEHGTGDKKRDICLIPVSAHGTNPASASMAGMRVVPIKCDTQTGNLDLEDLEAKCKEYQDELGAIMVTYPSTFGVFEPEIRKACDLVHQYGGQVYMDGANMNAQIGLCSPGDIGADVCHLNLHKTFCIPHGGGGPGVGPICVKKHLCKFLPGNPKTDVGMFPVSSARYGSASITLISFAYNTLMGAPGLKLATKIGLLNANYLLSRLKAHYSILYTNEQGRCAHEFILDVRPFSKSAGVEAIDIAKRLQDYGFHAPTMSWPVANTLMIEPTESESKQELDRFVDALVNIRQEIREIEEGKVAREGNVLKMAPHPMKDLIDGDGDGKWNRSYSREKAAYPVPWLREKKFWPTVARVDDAYGDTNLFCTCPPVEDTTGDV